MDSSRDLSKNAFWDSYRNYFRNSFFFFLKLISNFPKGFKDPGFPWSLFKDFPRCFFRDFYGKTFREFSLGITEDISPLIALDIFPGTPSRITLGTPSGVPQGNYFWNSIRSNRSSFRGSSWSSFSNPHELFFLISLGVSSAIPQGVLSMIPYRFHNVVSNEIPSMIPLGVFSGISSETSSTILSSFRFYC